MKIGCDIICDLLPLYKDHVASNESREAIKEHLKTCPACRRYYRTLAADIKASDGSDNIFVSPTNYSAISHKIKKRRRIYFGTATAILLFTVGLSLYTLIKDLNNQE